MATRGVSVLKFVGTVSLGLLTNHFEHQQQQHTTSHTGLDADNAVFDATQGFSYSLSTLTIPTLLTLPSANDAAKAFESLTASAKRQLRTLSSLSGTAFLCAYFFSPRTFRHPYLLYTSLAVFSSNIVTSPRVVSLLGLQAPPKLPSGGASSPSSSAAAAARKQKKEHAARARMEASYEVLGAGSDLHSDGTSASGEDLDIEEENVNGEEVRANVEYFLKKQIIQTSLAGLGFFVSVLGIWGDGVGSVYARRH